MANPQDKSAPVVQEARQAYSGAFLHLAIYAFFCQIAVLVLAQTVRIGNGGVLPTLAKFGIQFGIMYGAGIPLYLLISKNSPKSVPEKHPLKFWHYLLLIPCLLCVMYTGNLIGTLFTALVAALSGIDLQSTTIQQNVYGEYGYIMVAAAVLLAPVAEELLFRKVLLDRIRPYGEGRAIFLSGLFFGLFHGNFTQFFYSALTGFLLAYVYVRTGRVRNTIILHMTVNFFGGALPYFVDAESIIKELNDRNLSAIFSNTPFLFYMISVLSLAFVGLILLIVFRKDFRLEKETEKPLPEGTARYAVTANIGFWAMALFCVFDFILQFAQK